MQRPTTLPSSTSRAGNSVVVPLRLSSWVIVPHLPAFSGRPGWVRSSAWIRLFSSIESTTACGRVHVQADDVLDLLGEGRVVGALEGADAVRLQPVRFPDPLHCAGRRQPSGRPRGRSNGSLPPAVPRTAAPAPSPPSPPTAAPCRVCASCHAASRRRPLSQTAAASATPPAG